MKDSGVVELFINRELSWIEFNHRVLEEAMDPNNPLLERLRFISIAASNLDEFFMVRVASLKQREEDGYKEPDAAGYTPSQALQAIAKRVHQFVDTIYDTVAQLLPQIKSAGIVLHSWDELSPDQQSFAEAQFENEIFPVLTPMALDPAHPFPILLNLSLNLGVLLSPTSGDTKNRLAVVPIPAGLPRLVSLPKEANTHHFILLEEIVRRFLPRLFAGQEIVEKAVFRIARDAELEFDDEGSPSLMKTIETELQKRRTNPAVRFEVEKGISDSMKNTFLSLVQVEDEELYLIPQFVDPRFLSNLSDLPGFDALRYKALPPQPAKEFQGEASVWSILKERDVVLHHPYESFEPIVRMVSQAADDPDVLAIKQTLYRTSGDSPIVRALSHAALKGKQVTVLVELMARFDEERNIGWAKQLEKSGVHVIYGLAGLKTHAKILLVVRREPDGIHKYVHLSTGNYNDRTARMYTDFGLLTSDEGIGMDASGFFNTITGYSDPPAFRRLTMAPLGLRDRILHLIGRETERAKSGEYAMILAKMNSLVDPEIIRALYAASTAGVQIKLAVRGICCLRPKIKGVSEHISVISIVDRFLEHSRIFYFSNGGAEEYYCSSADWMPRNLDKRVELLFPIASEEGRRKIRATFELVFADNVKARVLQQDGTYAFRKRKRNEEAIRSQEALYQMIAQQSEITGPILFKPLTAPPKEEAM